jgi:hypothetical protein
MNSIQWNGQRITAPGVYAGIPLDDYHRGDICDGPSLSSSGLRTLWKSSPEHFWDASPLNPKRAEPEDKKQFVIGRAAHHLVCGEVGFSDHYIIRPEKAPDGRDWHGSNKSCIKWLADQKAAGLTVLTPDDAESVRGMAVALGRNKMMQNGILSGLVERSMFWRDKKTGVWLKARLCRSQDDKFGPLQGYAKVAGRVRILPAGRPGPRRRNPTRYAYQFVLARLGREETSLFGPGPDADR